MQLELEIFRQLQMKRKANPRPSDSSDNSGGTAAGPMSSSGSGPLSTPTGGVGAPSSSLSSGSVVGTAAGPMSSSGSGPLSTPTGGVGAPSLTHNEPLSNIGVSELPMLVAGQSVGGPPAVILPLLSQSQSVGSPVASSPPVSAVQQQELRPTQQRVKSTRPLTLSHGSSADTLPSSVPSTLSQVSHSVTQCDTADSDVSPTAASELSKPLTLSQDTDNSADIALETLSHRNTVSPSDADFCHSTVTQL